MTTISQDYVGIDVSKDRLDVVVLGEKQIIQVANAKKEIAGLAKRMLQLSPKLIVVKATGGYVVARHAVLVGFYLS